MRTILGVLIVLASFPAIASGPLESPDGRLSIDDGCLVRQEAAFAVEAMPRFSLGVRDRETRTASSGSSLPESWQGIANDGPDLPQASPFGSVRPDYSVGEWWKNSSTTTRVWSIVGTVLIVGIVAAAL